MIFNLNDMYFFSIFSNFCLYILVKIYFDLHVIGLCTDCRFPGIDTEYFVKLFCIFLEYIMIVDFHELK